MKVSGRLTLLRVLGWLALLLALLPPGSGPNLARADAARETYSTWRLTNIEWRDEDGRGVQAGVLTIDRVAIDARGGAVDITALGDAECPGSRQRFRYGWTFDRDISRVTGVQEDVVFTTTLYFEGDGPGADRQGRTCLDLNPFEGAGSPDELFWRNMGGEARFYFKPDHPFHVPGPRSFRLGRTWNQTGSLEISLSSPGGPRGFFFRAKYLFTADAAQTPQPPTTGGTVTTLGGLDLAGYCAGLGYDGAALSAGQWACTSPRDIISIDLNDACRWQYHDPAAYAQQREPGNPQTWTCFTGAVAAPVTAPTPPPITGTDRLGQVWDECETYGAQICGTWTRQGAGDAWQARWSNGATAQLTITATPAGEVTVTRADTGSPLRARYVGRFDAAFTTITGTVDWWGDALGPRSGTWRATVQR